MSVFLSVPTPMKHPFFRVFGFFAAIATNLVAAEVKSTGGGHSFSGPLGLQLYSLRGVAVIPRNPGHL